MFENFTTENALIYSSLIAFPCLLCAMLIRIRLKKYCRRHKHDKNDKHITISNLLILLTACVSGLFFGNIISIMVTFSTALQHGLTADYETTHALSYGEIKYYNKHSIEETIIDDTDELKGKAIIFVRYDCPDCVKLHEQLSQIDDIIFLASRSELGESVRDIYNICLTEVPQGVYIDPNGKATTINIVNHNNNTITLDLHQIATLRAMATHYDNLSDN